MKRLLLSLVTLILLSVLLIAFGNFACGIFQEPYTGGWRQRLAGKCWSLP